MTQIQPSYATFEQAKKLKEIGFDSYTNIGYSESGKKYYHQGGQEPVKNGQNYYEGRDYQGEPFLCSAPEQWEVVEWLRINHGIEIVVIPDSSSQSRLILRKYTYSIFTPVNGANLHCQIGRDKNKNIVYFINPQEAYSAAFDYVLNNLI